MSYDKSYGVCKFCGADLVQNPKTGKIFCSEKCWLKEKPQSTQSPTSPVNRTGKVQPQYTTSETTALLKEIDRKLGYMIELWKCAYPEAADLHKSNLDEIPVVENDQEFNIDNVPF